jgi:hypothetical protein
MEQKLARQTQASNLLRVPFVSVAIFAGACDLDLAASGAQHK